MFFFMFQLSTCQFKSNGFIPLVPYKNYKFAILLPVTTVDMVFEIMIKLKNGLELFGCLVKIVK